MNTTTPPIESCCAPEDERVDLRPVEGDDADEELASLAKAIGHPARVKILRILVRRNSCICGDIVDELPLAQSTVSQHLKVLIDRGHRCRGIDLVNLEHVLQLLPKGGLYRTESYTHQLQRDLSSPSANRHGTHTSSVG